MPHPILPVHSGGRVCAKIYGNTVGQAFYQWLTEIGAVGKDAAGTERGAAWWPGAYQAN